MVEVGHILSQIHIRAGWGGESRVSKTLGWVAKTTVLCALVAIMVGCMASVALAADSIRIQDDDSAVAFSGRWTFESGAAFSGFSARRSSTAGARVTLGFDGEGVSVVAVRGAAGGLMRVSIDGTHTTDVSLYSAEATDSVPLFTTTGLAPGPHSISVEVLGTRETGSVGDAVTIDGFDVWGTALPASSAGTVRLEQSSARLYRTKGWSTREAGGASGGSAIETSKSGTGISARFHGSGISWIGRRGATGGLAAIFLDGKRVATVDTGGGSGEERRVMWAASGLSHKVHTLTVRALGEVGAAGGDAAIDVDAFVVRGVMQTAYRPTPFHYPWRTYILIDKSDFRLYWVKDGMLVKSYPIAHGKRWGWTPARVWRIDQKYPHTGGVYGPRKMRLFKRVRTRHGYAYVRTAYGIHGTNQPWVIGTMASHGCIRMYNRDVKDLYPRVPMHTMVVTRD